MQVILGQAGGQGYEPNSPKPPDPIVVTCELYVEEHPPPSLKIRGVGASYAASPQKFTPIRGSFFGGEIRLRAKGTKHWPTKRVVGLRARLNG